MISSHSSSKCTWIGEHRPSSFFPSSTPFSLSTLYTCVWWCASTISTRETEEVMPIHVPEMRTKYGSFRRRTHSMCTRTHLVTTLTSRSTTCNLSQLMRLRTFTTFLRSASKPPCSSIQATPWANHLVNHSASHSSSQWASHLASLLANQWVSQWARCMARLLSSINSQWWTTQTWTTWLTRNCTNRTRTVRWWWRATTRRTSIRSQQVLTASRSRVRETVWRVRTSLHSPRVTSKATGSTSTCTSLPRWYPLISRVGSRSWLAGILLL